MAEVSAPPLSHTMARPNTYTDRELSYPGVSYNIETCSYAEHTTRGEYFNYNEK